MESHPSLPPRDPPVNPMPSYLPSVGPPDHPSLEMAPVSNPIPSLGSEHPQVVNLPDYGSYQESADGAGSIPLTNPGK